MSDNVHPDTDTGGFRLTGWHVLAILGGFFAVVFTVNAIFVTQAVQTFPGEDVKKSYVQGLNFNDTLAARAAQADLGWQVEMGLVGAGAERALLVRFSDSDGQALSSLTTVVNARRLATDAADLELNLAPLGNGEYGVDASGLATGAWEMRLDAYRPGEDAAAFTARKRLMVR